MPPERLRNPSDVLLAHRMFEANCGPAALAAILSLQVCNVMQFFPHFPRRPYTNLTHMREALARCQLEALASASFPDFGLTLIQFEGPWTDSVGRSTPRWAAHYRHWIGVANGAVYDVNLGRWTTCEEWEASVLNVFRVAWPRLTGWRVERSLRVVPQRFFPKMVVRGLFL